MEILLLRKYWWISHGSIWWIDHGYLYPFVSLEIFNGSTMETKPRIQNHGNIWWINHRQTNKQRHENIRTFSTFSSQLASFLASPLMSSTFRQHNRITLLPFANSLRPRPIVGQWLSWSVAIGADRIWRHHMTVSVSDRNPTKWLDQWNPSCAISPYTQGIR